MYHANGRAIIELRSECCYFKMSCANKILGFLCQFHIYVFQRSFSYILQVPKTSVRSSFISLQMFEAHPSAKTLYATDTQMSAFKN